jgi:hypothetical protein
MRNLKLVFVLALVIFLGFRSNAVVAMTINSAVNMDLVTPPKNIIDVIVHGKTMQINSNEIGNVQVTVIKSSNNEIIFQDILTPGDVRILNNLTVSAYIIIAHYESNTQTQTVSIE